MTDLGMNERASLLSDRYIQRAAELRMPVRGHTHNGNRGVALKRYDLGSGRGGIRMQDESRQRTRAGTLHAVSHCEARGLERPRTPMDDVTRVMAIAVMSSLDPDAVVRSTRLHIEWPGASSIAARGPWRPRV